MPLAHVAGSYKRPRSGPRAEIFASRGRAEGRAFNNLPAIVAAFPKELSAIVAETTDDLAILSTIKAPTEAHPRKGDPAPGTLKASTRVRIYLRRATDTVVTGKVDFPAKDRRGHRYAKPVETGSYRRSIRGRSRIRHIPAQPFLVDAAIELRPVFTGRLAGLEARLPR